MADPINSNSRNSSCLDPAASDCIIWSGNSFSCLSLCKGDSLTSVINKLGSLICKDNTVKNNGSWVNFDSSIPSSGTTPSSDLNYTFSNPGISIDTISGGYNNPSYRFNVNGDLQFRGTITFTFTSSKINNISFAIVLGNIPLTSFATPIIKSQVCELRSCPTGININSSSDDIASIELFLIIDPSGNISLYGMGKSIQTVFNYSLTIPFDGVQFNIG